MAAVAAVTMALACCSDQVELEPARVEPARTLAAEVDAERVLAAVSELVEAHRSDTPLDCGLLEDPEPELCHLTHRHARDWLAATFAELGYDVVREKSRDGAFEVENVIAVLPGNTSELVVVGAHYDALYAAANDNSTGVAVLVELARIAKARRFERTVHFVGFDLEELGMLGSTAYVSAHPAKPVAVFNIDGVGFSAPTQGTVPAIPLPSRGDFLALLANDASIELAAETRALALQLELGRVEAIIAPGDGTAPLLGLIHIGSGDKTPFWVADMPALMFTDTQPFRDDGYHSSKDTVARLDPGFLADNARIAAAALVYVAGAAP